MFSAKVEVSLPKDDCVLCNSIKPYNAKLLLRRFVVLRVGAGFRLSSGIPTFREHGDDHGDRNVEGTILQVTRVIRVRDFVP